MTPRRRRLLHVGLAILALIIAMLAWNPRVLTKPVYSDPIVSVTYVYRLRDILVVAIAPHAGGGHHELQCEKKGWSRIRGRAPFYHTLPDDLNTELVYFLTAPTEREQVVHEFNRTSGNERTVHMRTADFGLYWGNSKSGSWIGVSTITRVADGDGIAIDFQHSDSDRNCRWEVDFKKQIASRLTPEHVIIGPHNGP